MKYQKRTKEETNRLALIAKEKGEVTTELWEAVKGVALSVLYKKWKIDREEHESIAAQAVCKALKMWEPSRGDFPLTVYNWTNHFAGKHFHEFHHILRISMHKSAEEIKSLSTIHPDGAKSVDGSDCDLWDSFDSCITHQSYDEPNEIETAVEQLSGRLKRLYHLKYELNLTSQDVAEIFGKSQSSIRDDIKVLKAKVKQNILRERAIEKCKKCQERGFMSDKLFDNVKKVAFKRLHEYKVPVDEHLSLAALSIHKALQNWNCDKDFGLKVWSHTGAEAQAFYRSQQVVKPASVSTIRKSSDDKKELLLTSVVYPSDYETGDDSYDVDGLYGSVDPETFSRDLIDIALEVLDDDERELLDKMLSVEFKTYTSTHIAKEYNISKQALHKRFDKLKKKLRYAKKVRFD